MALPYTGSITSRPYRYMRPILYKHGHKGLKFFGAAFGCMVLSGLMVFGLFSMRGQLSKASRNVSVNVQNLLTPATAQASRGASPNNPALQAAIEQAVSENRAFAWGVTVHDLGSDQLIANFNGDRQMASASLYKLYVVRALAEKVPFGEWSTQRVGGRTIASCVDLMLRISDNPCAEMLADYVGWVRIDEMNKRVGYIHTGFHRTYGFVTTSYDTTLFMRDLHMGKMLDAEATNFVLDSLSKQKHRGGIPAGCKDCKTWNKTGDLNEAKHDTAIVQSGSSTYAVTIMSEGGSFVKIASIQQAIERILKS